MSRAVRRPKTAKWHATQAAGVMLAMSAASAARADEAKLLAYGRHLASECTTCHRIDGTDNGIPAITGWAVSEFIQTLGFYKTGVRNNQVMESVAQTLDDDQVKALATYYASLPRPERKKR
ncbi:MAG: hypothetical protein R3D68_14610 [Hyphomicrobiaceae bacterium]